MPRLDTRHLTMLLALAESGSVTQAAQRLGITQSAVTHRIGEAQRRLGVKLVKRVGRRLVLTPAAERLHAMAIRAVGEMERVEREIMSQHGRSMHLVRFGQATYSRYRWLPGFLRRFEQELADIEIDLVARATFQPLRLLQDGEVDVVSACGPKGPTGSFRWTHLMQDSLVAILPPDHALRRRPYVDPAELRNQRLLAPAVTHEPGFAWNLSLHVEGLAADRAREVELPEAIIDLVAAGLGISMLPLWIVEPEVEAGLLVALPLTRTGIRLDWWAVTRITGVPDPAVSRFVRALVTWCTRA